MSSERNNQLTDINDYDVERIIFSEPQQGSVPNSVITYKRINISTLNKDGTVGDLIIPTQKVFSFGVSENINQETGKTTGHVLPLCLWDRNGASKYEKKWTDVFTNIVDHCKEHLVENKKEIEQYELEFNDLKKFNPLYWKREKGEIVKGLGPTLYVKLITSKKHNKILSMFFNPEGESVDPLNYLGKYCYVKAAVKIESIFIGTRISLQVKLYEAEIELVQSGMKSLMPRKKANTSILKKAGNNLNEIDDDDSDDESDGSIEDDSDSEPEPEPVKKVKKVTRKKH